MADRKDTASKTGMNIDTALVRELAEMLSETGLAEIEVEDGTRKIRISKGGSTMVPMAAPATPPAPVASPVPSSPSESAATSTAQTSEAAGDPVLSPMVGTVYLASEPGAANFIKVGDTVKEGDTLVIIEAMKVMNPIASTKAGTVKAILVDNAQPVEFDQPLVILD